MRTSFKFPTEPAAATGAAAAPSTSRSFSPSQSTTMPRGNSMSASTAAFGRVPSGLGISQIIHDDLSTVAVGARQGRSRGESLFRLPKDVVAALSDSTTLVAPGDVDKVYAKMRRRNREISFMLPDDTAGSDLLSLSKTRSSTQQLQSTASGAALSSPWLSSSPSSPAGGGATASSFLPAIPTNDSLAGGAAGGGGGGRKRAVGFTQALASDDSPPAPVDLNLVEISAAARALIASVDVFTEQTMHPKAAAASADGGGEGSRSKSTVGERSRSNTATVGSKRTTLVPGKPDSDASPASSGLSGSRGGAPRGSRMKSVARVASVLSGGSSTDAESSGSPQTAASPATGGGDGRRKSVAANAMPTLTPTKPNADRRKSRVG